MKTISSAVKEKGKFMLEYNGASDYPTVYVIDNCGGYLAIARTDYIYCCKNDSRMTEGEVKEVDKSGNIIFKDGEKVNVNDFNFIYKCC